MVDKIGEIKGQKSSALQELVSKFSGDISQNRTQENISGRTGTAIKPADLNQLSQELMDQLAEKGDQAAGADVSSILKNILEDKDSNTDEDMRKQEEDATGASSEAQEEPQDAANANETKGTDDKKQEVEEVKVEWQPLVKEGDIVETGEAWGKFNVKREKKQPDGENGDNAKGNSEKSAGANAQGSNKGNGFPMPAMSSGDNGKQLGKSIGAAGKIDRPKGVDGKTPMVAAGTKPGEDSKKEMKASGGQSYQMGDKGKILITDTGTGEKMEVPENGGDMKATHPMKIKNIGSTGELKPGDTLFSYENPSSEDKEKKKQEKEGNNKIKEMGAAAGAQNGQMKPQGQ